MVRYFSIVFKRKRSDYYVFELKGWISQRMYRMVMHVNNIIMQNSFQSTGYSHNSSGFDSIKILSIYISFSIHYTRIGNIHIIKVKNEHEIHFIKEPELAEYKGKYTVKFSHE